MNGTEIFNTIKNSRVALSSKGIARNMGIDADSSDLQAIEHECWELADAGVLIAYDRREENQGLFFGEK